MTAATGEAPREGAKIRPDLDAYVEGLRGWFERLWPAARELEVVDLSIPTATGFSNETVFFALRWREAGESRERRYVARVEPHDGPLFPAQTPAGTVSVELQHRIMSGVASAGAAPVPRLLPYEPDRSVLGRPFFAMEFVPGVVPADVPRYTQAGFLVDEATPAQRARLIESGLEAMAGIHALDRRRDGLDWLDPSGDGNPGMAHQRALYRAYADAELAGREHPVLYAALDWLDRHDPGDGRVGLTWGDARIGNVIWQDYRCAAVCDWEACALCPTEADVGWWLMFDRLSHEGMDAPRLPGFPTRERMVAHYEKVSGREVRAPDYWEVFGLMRFCAIYVRLGDRMEAHGLVPPEASPAVENQVTEALAQRLEALA